MSFPVTDLTGRAFGERWHADIHATVAGYAELFAAHKAKRVRVWSEQALAAIDAWSPDLATEIRDIAAGAGLEAWQVASLNARTEILAAARVSGVGECSTAVLLDPVPRTIQTWDWVDRLSFTPVLWHFGKVRTFTEFGVLAKIGLNANGLGLHFNILEHVSDSDQIGVPVHVLARRILDEAATVAEAVDIVRSARTSASTAITVVTGKEAATIEVSPAGIGVVPARDGVLLHCNHFLDDALADGERLGPVRPGTYDRLAYLREHADDLRTDDMTKRATAMLSHRPAAPVCAHPEPDVPFQERWESVATISLDLANGRLLAHQGGPCRVRPSTWQVI
ncbi:C45 family autoproteolytic acyltransferase/hydolase [Fodinicola acaciae]|uniref:C45 family autoproteolytic acyltransferase/hydolase n=1 Tax=Fodinicola acaciae TaxID=2681555 RepID=UPI0013D27BBC|nr:C45 family peptidase [Fodinicola acaciae]